MTPARRDLFAILLLAFALGLVVAWASLTLRFGTRADTLHNLDAVLRGAPFRSGTEFVANLPFYNRVLVPLLHRGLSRALPVLSEGQWYLLLRLAAFQAAFAAFALVCHLGLRAPRPLTGLASCLLAVATIASFNFPWEEASDALDLLVLALGVGASLGRRWLVCLGLSLLFAANRESAAFLGLIWALLTATRADWPRRLAEGAVICGLSYGTALALKKAIGPVFIANYYTPAVNLDRLLTALVTPNPMAWLPMLLAVVALLVSFADRRAGLVRRLFALAALFVGFVALFGVVGELRVFLPTFVMLAFAVAASPQRTAV